MKTILKPLCAAIAICTAMFTSADANTQSRTFFCGEGSNVTVSVIGQSTIRAGLIDGQMRIMQRDPSDRFRFLQGDYGVRILNPNQIQIEIPDFGTIDCVWRTAQRPSTPQFQAQARFPHRAKSWGGIVRSGPGVGYRRAASLSNGERITILGQANAPFYQGRPWFKIRYRGRVGYHWGGIICPIGNAVAGTFQVCH